MVVCTHNALTSLCQEITSKWGRNSLPNGRVW